MQIQNYFVYQPISQLKQHTIELFEASQKAHLLITGSKGVGKTTLCEALVTEHSVPGLRSYAQRGSNGIPHHIFLEERIGTQHCCIGTFENGVMQAHPNAFNTIGIQLLCRLERTPSPWIMLDEIGFLEQSSSAYREKLEKLFDTKRIIAALRKANTPFLCKLRSRSDCFVIDLDEFPDLS